MLRLGIRRKVIGTLILVGLFPLALSLVIILMGGAAMRLTSIKNDYQHMANDSSHQIVAALKRQVDQIRLVARLPNEVAFVREQNNLRLRREIATTQGATVVGESIPSPYAKALEKRWPTLTVDDPVLHEILNNSITSRLHLIQTINPQPGRQLLVTDAAGQTIAADEKPTTFFHADQEWWQEAYNGGIGRIYISSVLTDPHNQHNFIIIAVPVLDDGESHHVIGIVRDRLDLDFLRQPFQYAVGQSVLGQVFDLSLNRTVVMNDEAADPEQCRRAETDYHKGKTTGKEGLFDQFFVDLVVRDAPIAMDQIVPANTVALHHPQWVVIVSKPAQTAMTPVYNLALTVAGIGAALIVALFVLGVAISNREIIIPIMRLREATAAVGRGELNIRLMSSEKSDPTFRGDEIGDLARDFDEMTRQLQKNMTQLERSNEAKRRFMELAGHELRTPVTYILGVCQLLQRARCNWPQKNDDESVGGSTVTARSTAAMQGAVTKIIAKTQRLSRIIENLLKLVNNNQFTTRTIRQAIDMRALILQVCNDNRPFVLERKQQMQIDVPEILPPFEGDRDKLEDVLTNLISNAIRFSPDHSTVKVAARQVVGDMLEIIVEDAGTGISADDLANLFEPFYTGTDIMHHHSGTFEFGSKGIGLGLAIVRRFVEIHGGIVQAHATGHGTQFQILLPLMQSGGADGAVASAESP